MSEPYVPPPPPPMPPTAPPPAASSNRSLMLVLSYLGLLGLIPLLVEKDDAEVQWHAKNGLVFTGAFMVLFVLLSIVGMLPFAGCLTLLVWPFAGLAWLVVTVMGIIKAVNGERFVIPGLSDLVAKF